MKSSNKRSFLGVFGIIFSVTMIILGSLQAYFGSLRLFDPIEEKYESTQQTEAFVINPVERNIFYFASTTEGKKQKDAIAYLSENSAALEDVLRSVPPQKAEKILKKIQEIQQQASVTKPVIKQEPEKAPVEVFVSPVLLQISPESSSAPKGYQDMVYTVAEGPYFRQTLWDFPIVINTKRVSPRGQVYNGQVTLSGTMTSITEASKVLVHELGHMIDIYYLRETKKTADPSGSYYGISWSEPTVMRSTASSKDFISGYAASNQYEDFAEAFAFYVFHNTEFEARALSNAALQKKYDFLHDDVFGDIFLGTAYEKNVIPNSFWDVTKIVLGTSNLSDIFAGLGRIFKMV